MNAERRNLEKLIDASVRRQKEKTPEKTAFGTYWDFRNGILIGVEDNTLPLQGMIAMLNGYFRSGTSPAPANNYLGLYANAINPASGWTAANVVATAGEIVDADEGYSQATRPLFAPATATGSGATATIDSVGTESQFTIVTASELLVEGVFCISDNAKGGTAGVLASAARYALTRHLNNGDDYRLGFRVTLTSA